MINRYDTLITVISRTKKKMLSLKFKIIDGHLYAYNMFYPLENRKMVEVISINNVNISDIIDKIKENDLYNVELLKKYGIDTSDKFVLGLYDDDSIVKFDVLSYDSNDNIFYKEHTINPNISIERGEIESNGFSTNNLMLDFASTNFKALLKLLKSNSISNPDKEIFDEMIASMDSINDNYANVINNLDMLFLSSQLLLMMEDKIDYIPDNISYYISIYCKFDYDNESLEINNSAILTNGKVDYIKVINMIRNAVAHSNYKVLGNGLIEFYDKGKKDQLKMHFTIPKEKIKSIFSMLYSYKYLNGVFPKLYYKATKGATPEPLSKDEIIEYLNGLIIYDINNYILSHKNDNDMRLDLHYFDMYHLDIEIEDGYSRRIKKHLTDDCQLLKHKLSDDDIKYILDNIIEMGEEYFYKLGSTSQKLVIENLIKQRYNKRYSLINNIDSIIETSYNSNESLTKRASDYINFKSKIELIITAILNNLLMFCYNQNVSNIDASSIKFPLDVYRQYMDSRIKEFYDVSKESTDYQNIYMSLLKAASMHMLSKEDYVEIEKGINKTKNVLIKCKNEINLSSEILDGNDTSENYDKVNKEILHRFRDCLAHGRLNIGNIDINNIGKTELSFYDTYEGQDKFKVNISLEELLKSINQPEFLKTMFNSNVNFNQHKL